MLERSRAELPQMMIQVLRLEGARFGAADASEGVMARPLAVGGTVHQLVDQRQASRALRLEVIALPGDEIRSRR